jgi:hypothetical protein
VTPITVVDNANEPSGTAQIEGARLELNLDAYTATTPLTLINAPAGQLLGQFGSVTFLGNTTAAVNYDVFNGDVFLNNFQSTAASASRIGVTVPEPSGGSIIALAIGVLLSAFRSSGRSVSGDIGG